MIPENQLLEMASEVGDTETISVNLVERINRIGITNGGNGNGNEVKI